MKGESMKLGIHRLLPLLFAVMAPGALYGQAAPTSGEKQCDDSLRAAFASDPETRVVLVRQFRAGEKLALGAEPPLPAGLLAYDNPTAANDLCMVKIIVGPGNPGPADAPSTSPGIGIEIWLPRAEKWNGRIHAIGRGGYAGGPAGSPAAITDFLTPVIADKEGAVSSVSDGGHPQESGMPGQASGGGDFGMNPNGTLNQALLKDFATRSLHVQALKTKTLTQFFYGKPARYAFWDGVSNGGRQAYALAQYHPEDFDGILGAMPAINWTRFIIADLYPQIVFQHDLGGRVPSEAQQDLVSNAAIQACDLVGGQHLGYTMDPAACRYDPTQDRTVLCKSDGGTNRTTDCVTRAQAQAINKIWYGMTVDGSVPSPSVDNGWDKGIGGARRWYGFPRGTSLYNATLSHLFKVNAGVTNVSGPFTHSTDGVALALVNPTMGSTNFRNASGDGIDLWKTLSYPQLANAIDRGIALQPLFGMIDADSTDLSAFKARGGKLLTWHGVHDEAIPVQGTIDYYGKVAARMGGVSAIQDFYRVYIVPGVGHATPNGTANPNAFPPVPDRDAFYQLLVAWVENGTVPERIELQNSPRAPVRRSQPICPFPQMARYTGGDPNISASYECS